MRCDAAADRCSRLVLESDDVLDRRARWQGSGPGRGGHSSGKPGHHVHQHSQGQVTVLAQPRESPEVQARCYARVLYPITGPSKRSQQGRTITHSHMCGSGPSVAAEQRGSQLAARPAAGQQGL